MFCVFVVGYLQNDDFDCDKYIFSLKDKELILFSVISLFSGALMIYGMQPTDEGMTSITRCKIGGIIGMLLWIFLISSLFVNIGYDSIFRFADYYFLNWLLLCATASAIVFFAFKYLLKKE